MYKLLDLDYPKRTIATAEELHVLFSTLDNPNYKHKRMVITDEDRNIVAGKACAWERSKEKEWTA